MRIVLFVFFLLPFLRCTPENGEKATEQEPWAFPYFEKADSVNPILSPTQQMAFNDPITQEKVFWEERNVLNPAAVVRNDTVFLLYRAQDQWGTSRIGLAYSLDGYHFEKRSTPVFYPERDAYQSLEWNYRKVDGEAYNEKCVSCYFDGVEDPRIVETSMGEYLMTYTAYDGKTARLSSARSSDLLHWEKLGPVLTDADFSDYWSKSGAIVTQRMGNSQVAIKIQGRYWMYFGDTTLFMASSEDLIHWTPLLDPEKGTLVEVLHPRPGYFDSRLVEPGPFAQYDKEKGILLLYNASNAAEFNDPSLPVFTYSAGQALFDSAAPYRLKARTASYFITPDKDYEKVGEVNNVCFVEGLVYFKEKWFLYYGTADSKIAVAVFDPSLKK